ncbi:hypothetical protein BD626DRAFT_496672 [Schizophyllum amplum]|uniref:Uncharacterized protein n=1 Tax=Schizophyllum amplum TaxID=97359 RepID=A0A550CDF8_9AGAR|nr:hypothetical protein BD626DRAFT_496672 [Auriculariopsis ampla]
MTAWSSRHLSFLVTATTTHAYKHPTLEPPYSLPHLSRLLIHDDFDFDSSRIRLRGGEGHSITVEHGQGYRSTRTETIHRSSRTRRSVDGPGASCVTGTIVFSLTMNS